jgi:hypothetical protein
MRSDAMWRMADNCVAQASACALTPNAQVRHDTARQMLPGRWESAAEGDGGRAMSGGIPDVLVSNQIVGPRKLKLVTLAGRTSASRGRSAQRGALDEVRSASACAWMCWSRSMWG